MDEKQAAMQELKDYRQYLTKQQVTTIKGQIMSGKITAAMKGLNRILERQGGCNCGQAEERNRSETI